MKKYLLLLSGLPGSGKTTWCKKFLHSHEPETAIWHSRDSFRFQQLKDGDAYFTYEDAVFNLWTKAIQSSLNDRRFKYVLADATHLSDKSRLKTLNSLIIGPNVEVVNIVFNVPLYICLQRNAQRTGRELVPEKVIKRMWRGFHMPDNGYRTVIVYQDGKELGSIE